MGEENITSNCHLFFWKAEDMGTEKGEWQPIEVDNVKIWLATDIPELEVKKLSGWNNTFSFTASGFVIWLVVDCKNAPPEKNGAREM